MLNFSRPALAALVVALLIFQPLSALAGEEGLFCWQVKSEKATVYLLGSVHAAKEDVYPLDLAISRAWAASPSLVVEVDLNSVDMAAMQAKLLTVGMCGAEETLQKLVSEETWGLLAEHCEERGMNAAGYNAMKPWLVAMFLTVTEMARAGYHEDLGIDRHFLELAITEEKPVLQLETGEFQLELLSGFDRELQELFLLSTLREIKDFEAHLNELFSRWERGDVDGLAHLFFEGVREDKRMLAVMEKLIFERNAAMAQKIAGYLREGRSCFVVVGAGHLAGERSIVDLLQKMDGASWTISRVAPAGRPIPQPTPALEAEPVTESASDVQPAA